MKNWTWSIVRKSDNSEGIQWEARSEGRKMTIQVGMDGDAEEECVDQANFKLSNGASSCEFDPKVEVRYKRRDICPGFMFD